jgi:hypothetical protein
MFGIVELEAYDAMLARIFREELERIVSRFERSRIAALRELERRNGPAQRTKDNVTSAVSSQYLFSVPHQPRGVNLAVADGRQQTTDGRQESSRQISLFTGPKS